ncbi:BspA family leucine-rich repeat surface protein [Campylobacter sp. RM12651]|uniref:BspA family leucine-rich repeat surface protein n=1 Tax=Campylobacter sp. RM12651 TaxID=1660079 RepID=UPI001EFC0303|nr:BspA family leucine-rich repeat surface protein [Campylobacter sp. RM12651]ULO04570.1 DUF285 domain-containing protein (tandem domains) [Campylobacter sp. RM12651]
MKELNLKPKTRHELTELLKVLDKEFTKNRKFVLITDLSEIDTSLITDMSYLFFGDIYNMPLQGVEQWNTSSVVNMKYMFAGCKVFNQPLNFDTSKVTTMEGMFMNCYNFNQPLNFDTSNVKDMNYMFSGCENFNQCLNFDTSKVTTMIEMFKDCKNLEASLVFDAKELINANYMFRGCRVIKKVNFLNLSPFCNLNGIYLDTIFINIHNNNFEIDRKLKELYLRKGFVFKDEYEELEKKYEKLKNKVFDLEEKFKYIENYLAEMS